MPKEEQSLEPEKEAHRLSRGSAKTCGQVAWGSGARGSQERDQLVHGSSTG